MNKNIVLKINQKYSLKWQSDSVLKKWNKEAKMWEPVLNKNNQEIPVKISFIKFPKDAKAQDYKGNQIDLNNCFFKTTNKLVLPHKFVNGQDLGIDEQSDQRLIFLKDEINYEVVHIPTYIDENNQKKYDFAQQVSYYLKSSEIKQAMDSWKQKEITKDDNQSDRDSSMVSENYDWDLEF